MPGDCQNGSCEVQRPVRTTSETENPLQQQFAGMCGPRGCGGSGKKMPRVLEILHELFGGLF